jgi:hypothetical protein
MKRTLFLILLCGSILCVRFLGQDATAKKYRQTLKQPQQISGYPCAKGYAWFYPGGKLASCFLAQDADFGVARAPAGSWIRLDADGHTRTLQLVRDTRIGPYTCRGGNRLLGPSEGATTDFYPSGKLRTCWLAADQDVQGVPCAGSTMFSGNSVVEFYESGKLKSCKLSSDLFRGHKSGERILLPH